MVHTLTSAKSNEELACMMVRRMGANALEDCSPLSPMAAAVQAEIDYRKAHKLPPFDEV